VTPTVDWTEQTHAEDPAIALLTRLGYRYVAPEALHAERESPQDAILGARLTRALQRLNDWMPEADARRLARELMRLPATTLLEASERAHTRMAYGASVEVTTKAGRTSRTARFFDFDDATQNELVVTRQYSVRGTKTTIRPDVVVFINGVPLAVIECKSPTLGEAWKLDAVEQLHRYQELDARYRERGAPRLFEAAQVLVATCGEAAVYGTVGTPYRHFVEWKTPWPLSSAQLEALAGRAPRAQEVTLAGLLAPSHLLDVLRNFVVFERDAETQATVRKVCRYPQFVAVQKALARVNAAPSPAERGGVVWHTQGSGKSLTMLWLALKLRRDPRHENPTLVIVTDRNDLDEQIERTFRACGYPNPERARDARELRELLAGPTGRTVLTTVQKFCELTDALARGPKSKSPGGAKRKAATTFPVLNTASNFFVLTDEAHRTQYGTLATHLRSALPHACFLGFTGTPIDRSDRSTRATFGAYIDTYTLEQSVLDGATVPILYEGRLPVLRVMGASLDALFDAVFADRTPKEREKIKQQFATPSALAGAPPRVRRICEDLLAHYASEVAPGGFKAQVVASSREVALAYKTTLDTLGGPESALVVSSSNDDDADLAAQRLTRTQRKALIARFLKKDDPLKILVVCDMLLTGFDAPIEQVMYLDAPLREHTLLQAIARVNRTAADKTHGLIVDYWGVSGALEDALVDFDPEDIKGVMTPRGDELPQLKLHHAAVCALFDPVSDRDDADAWVDALARDDRRAQFDATFRAFARSLDMVLPDPRALPFVADAKWFGKVRALAAIRYRDTKVDVFDCGARVRRLIADAIVADGIEVLVAPVSLFSPQFSARLAALRSDRARASETAYALRHEASTRHDDDPVFYTSLQARIEALIADLEAGRLDAAAALRAGEALTAEMAAHDAAGDALGLSPTGVALYGLLTRPEATGVADVSTTYEKIDDAKRALAELVEGQLAPYTALVDWSTKDEVQKEMRRLVKRQLRAASYGERVDAVAEAVVELLKRRRGG
jgi:type I restriction enzyme R subunit